MPPSLGSQGTRALVALSLGATVVLAGCGLFEPGSALQDDLTAERVAWDALGYTDYSFTMTVRCVCTGIVNVPTRVTVTNDAVAALVFVDSGEPVPSEHYRWYLTIDQLFDALQEAIDGKAELIGVAYDRDLHYPSTVAIDYSLIQIVEEVRYDVSDLVPAGGPSSPLERIDG